MKRILSVFVIACCLFFLATAVFSIFINSHFVLAQEDEQEATQEIELHRRNLVAGSMCTPDQTSRCLSMCFTRCTVSASGWGPYAASMAQPTASCATPKCMGTTPHCDGMGNCIP